MGPLSYRLLEGDWPVLHKAQPPSPSLLEKIKMAGTGTALANDIGFVSLGYFFICTSLLEAHPTQRDTNQDQVQILKKNFEETGIRRTDNPGVVIGLGEGWYSMKNSGPHNYMISDSSPHLGQLRTTSEGPIGQIIRGGHRTAAIRNLSRDVNASRSHENYWYYRVLLPGRVAF